MDPPPPPYEREPPVREKLYTVTTKKLPDYRFCHESLVLEATKFVSFIADELQYEKSLTDHGTSRKLWDKFFKNQRPTAYFHGFFASNGHDAYTSHEANFVIFTIFKRTKITTGDVEPDFLHICSSKFPLSKKRKL